MPEKTRWRRLAVRIRRRPLVAALLGLLFALATLGSAWGVFSSTPAAKVLAALVVTAAGALTPIQWIATAVMLISFGLLLTMTIALILPQRTEANLPPQIDPEVIRGIADEYSASLRRSVAKLFAETQAAAPDELEARKLVRERNGVRPLSAFEAGLEVHRLPNGVFGFVDAFDAQIIHPTLRFVSQTAMSHSEMTVNFNSKRARATWSGNHFEFHKLEEYRLFLFGFASAADALRLEEGASSRVWLLTRPWGDAKVLVSVDLERVSDARLYSTPDGSAKRLELTLSERASSPPPSVAPAPSKAS